MFRLNIACIFSPPPAPGKTTATTGEDLAEDLPQEQEDNQHEPAKKREALAAIITDYNASFGTNHRLDDFYAYYRDVQEAHQEPEALDRRATARTENRRVHCRGHAPPKLTLGRLRGISVLLPTNEAEQSKIAGCLQSLDELIAAETEKLEALKRHKKGLLQQLFPAEGETTPRLRFPQFRNAEEWQGTELREMAKYQNGKAYERDIVPLGKYVVVNAGFIASDGNSRKHSNADHLLAQKGDVLMVLSDLPNGRALAKCFLVNAHDTYAVNQRVALIRPTKVDSLFLACVLDRNSKLLAYNDGMNQTHLSKEAVESLQILLPCLQEQCAVSNCLSFLDAQISSMIRTVAVLRRHKAALMQQLFPSLDER